jgi:hypothetical protein
MPQVVQCLPSKNEALGSSPSLSEKINTSAIITAEEGNGLLWGSPNPLVISKAGHPVTGHWPIKLLYG